MQTKKHSFLCSLHVFTEKNYAMNTDFLGNFAIFGDYYPKTIAKNIYSLYYLLFLNVKTYLK